MSSRSFSSLVAAALCGTVLVMAACTRDFATLGPAEYPSDPGIFGDAFASGVGYQAFGGSKLDALSVDLSTHHSGTSSFLVTVPSPGDPSGGFAGGAFVAGVGRDLTGYDALTFWAKASMPATLNSAGIGNDNTGTSRYVAEVVGGLALTPSWKKYIIPIPDPKKLTQERGLFYYAEGPENGAGYEIWLDDASFEHLGTNFNPRPLIPSGTSQVVVGQTVKITGSTATYTVNGVDETLSVAPDYFTYLSSNPTVAVVAADGTILVVGAGNANITAQLGGVTAAGSVALNAVPLPTAAAPAPTHPASDVISMFSNAYPSVPVDKWSADWDHADVADIKIAGDDVKQYTNIGYAGIEFIANQINATQMTTLHLDVFVLDAAAFKIKLVDFGGNGVFGGGDDSEQQLTFTTPAITAGAWNSLDIPLSAFTGLTSRAHLAQMVIEGSSPVVFLDNLYFWGRVVPPSPTTVAPTPTLPAGSVISLFSSAYTNVPVDTWLASWSGAQSALVDPYTIAGTGHDVKKYTLGNYAGIEFLGAHEIDASAMTYFHMDVWSPEAQHLIVKIHDAGADGTVGTGDDSEGLFAIGSGTTPALTGTGQWVSLDIPFSAFTVSVGSVWNRAHLAQIVLVEDNPPSGGTLYVDNVYFAATASPVVPTVAAPTPVVPAANVISLFSDAYTNVTVDTWSAVWDAADVADIQIAGNNTKEYTNMVFAGIEFTSAPIDATAMTTLHFDIWTPNPTALPAAFKFKLVDFGANGVFGGGDDTEQELSFDANSTPHLVTGSWVSYDVPLASFTGLLARAHLAQIVISGGLNHVYLDNLYLYSANVSPTVAAPTPTVPAGKVISLFSDAYTNVTVDTWSAVWDAADVADVQVAGNNTKEYTNMVFAGIEFTSAPIDATAMTNVHFDIWTPNPTALPAAFKFKLVDFGANGAFGGGDDTEQELSFDANSTPPLVTGNWVSYDIPLASFTGLLARAHLAQIVISGGLNHVYIDNVYFYDASAPPTVPSAPAAAPVFAPGNVISLFSDAYTNVTVDTWSAVWDAADVADTTITGNNVKKYTNLVFAGIEATSAPIDASAMTNFYLDLWTPDPTASPKVFRIKLVDFGANGVFGGGDDVEHELTFSAATVPALVTGNWIRFDIPFSAFTGLVTRSHLAQLIISGDLPTVYVDNVLLHN